MLGNRGNVELHESNTHKNMETIRASVLRHLEKRGTKVDQVMRNRGPEIRRVARRQE